MVETSRARWLSAVTDVHHKDTEREGELTEDSRIDYPLDTERNRSKDTTISADTVNG